MVRTSVSCVVIKIISDEMSERWPSGRTLGRGSIPSAISRPSRIARDQIFDRVSFFCQRQRQGSARTSNPDN